MSARILIVDDEPRSIRLMEANLVNADYDVLTGINGQEAVDLVIAERPDLVLLDVMMPVLDGIEACDRIRKFSNVPIIMVTALGDERDRIRGLDVGADDYIVKPYSAIELLARVRAVLRRAQIISSAIQQTAFRHGNLRVEFARAEVLSLDASQRTLQSRQYHFGSLLFDPLRWRSDSVFERTLLERILDQFVGGDGGDGFVPILDFHRV